jgi:LEA14-like dessication related protein
MCKKLITGLLLAMLSACAPLKPIEIKKAESARLLNYSTSGAEVEVSLLINNPNKQGFKVSSTDLDLKLSGKKVGKGKLKKKVKIRGNSEMAYTFIIQGEIDNLLSSGGISSIADIFSKRSINLGVEGTITGKKLFLKRSFPISETLNIPLNR